VYWCFRRGENESDVDICVFDSSKSESNVVTTECDGDLFFYFVEYSSDGDGYLYQLHSESAPTIDEAETGSEIAPCWA